MSQKKTFGWYTKQLGISERTAKRWGKSKLEKLLAEKNTNSLETADSVQGIQGIQGKEKGEQKNPKAPYVKKDKGILDISSLDEVTKEEASVLLNRCMGWLDEWLKFDNQPNHQNYKAQIIVTLIRVITGGK